MTAKLLNAALAAALLSYGANAAIVTMNAPALDKWMYGNVSGVVSGDSQAAPVFALTGDSGLDRLGGLLTGFDTRTAQIPTGLGASAYQITSVRLTVTVISDRSFLYDPTQDSYRAHLPTNDPAYQADSDAGHPLQVFGVGLRNGYTTLSTTKSGTTGPNFHEYSEFGPATSPNAFPIGQNAAGQPLVGVSDNVDQRLEAIPFASGTATGLTPGTAVPAETQFIFDLNLSDPVIRAYLQNALNDGILGLFVSSLDPAVSQGGPVTYPRLFTKEGAADALAPEFSPRLEIQYTTIPEPRASLLALVGVSLFAAGRGIRHRHSLS